MVSRQVNLISTIRECCVHKYVQIKLTDRQQEYTILKTGMDSEELQPWPTKEMKILGRCLVKTLCCSMLLNT